MRLAHVDRGKAHGRTEKDKFSNSASSNDGVWCDVWGLGCMLRSIHRSVVDTCVSHIPLEVIEWHCCDPYSARLAGYFYFHPFEQNCLSGPYATGPLSLTMRSLTNRGAHHATESTYRRSGNLTAADSAARRTNTFKCGIYDSDRS